VGGWSDRFLFVGALRRRVRSRTKEREGLMLTYVGIARKREKRRSFFRQGATVRWDGARRGERRIVSSVMV